jgi:MoxR-like ATPase
LVGARRLSLSQRGVNVSKASSPLPAPLRARQAPPGASNHLIGRQDEIDAVLSALRAGSFVNVWGECGAGKTSLLRHVAYRAAQEFYGRSVIYHSAANDL